MQNVFRRLRNKGLVLLAAAVIAATANDARADGSPVADPAAVARAGRLAALFQALKTAPGPDQARPLEAKIEAEWMHSGSDTADLFLQWAIGSMMAGRNNEALQELDNALSIRPDFAEALNKRATLYFAMQKLDLSMRDIASTLQLEPHHFGALAGLGMILEIRGDKGGALEAYRMALDADPFLPSLQERAKKLAKQGAGDPI